ncbi:hypothetical protein HIM_11005 [Hirsutella minnesotensis 3608]|uniref:Uncharacterized protein n=1 Tax=Hirsutella minnesotensis 3608 TaxID=1043627 RepID=A0A0F7ZWV2_9HYPO|nr:hypothetical protein HIM_11005 [Hirsutella minnesotensis 3608]
MHRWILAAAAAAAHFACVGGRQGKPNFSFETLWSLESNFWRQFLYPNNLQQINATADSVFAEDVRGRIDITRTFNGRELNNEYIFGLFAQPESLSFTGVPIAYNITQFAANQNIASATTVITFNVTAFGVFLPLTIDSWISFNADGKISQYDASFRWFDFFLDAVIAAAAKKLHSTNMTEVQAIIATKVAEEICKTSETYCLEGKREHYGSRKECMNLLKEIRFGRPFELGMNTLLCREVHKHMVQYRPDEHCSHIARSGGAFCVDDLTYKGVVTQRYFKDSWVPYGFAENNIWIA